MPKVSVIIPNYNHGRFLKKRIQTVLDQTYQDFEVIYLDDASTDDSNDLVKEFLGDPRISVVRNEVNSGNPFLQWNKGVKLAQGEYVWIAESDDYADPRFLATLVDILDANPGVGLAYCQSSRIDENDQPVIALEDFLTGEGRWSNDFINDGRDECKRFLASRNTIPNASAILLRRSAYEKAGFADESLQLCGDWMMWMKVLLVSDVAFVARRLNFYRTNSNSVRHRNTDRITYHEEAYRVVLYALEHVTIPHEILEQTCQTLLGGWVESIIRRRTLKPWNQTKSIYRNASNVDQKLKSRFMKNLASVVANSFRPNRHIEHKV